MNGGSRIVDLRPGPPDAHATEPAPMAFQPDDIVYEAVPDDDPAPRGAEWLVPGAAILLSIFWLAAMLWFAVPTLLRQPPGPVGLAEFVAALCMPPALLGVLTLLMLRTSRAEASRFGATARAMRAEAASLEETVAMLGDRLAANRRALNEQAGLLVSLSDTASERMRGLAGEMTAETQVLERICGALNDTADSARRNLGIVFDSLPKAQAETSRMSSALTEAGLTASERAASLGAQLATLAERARDADEVTGGAATRLAAHIARMESSSEVAAGRLDDAAGAMSAAVDAVLDRAASAIDEARKGIAAQGEAMLAMLGASQAALEKSGRDHAEALAIRLGEVETTVERIAGRLHEEQARTDTLFASLSVGVAGAGDQLDRLHADGTARTGALAASISALTGSADAMTESMRVGETTARALIATAEDLLTALDASSRELDETLPEALVRLDSRIAASRKLVGAAKPELLALVTAAESTHDAVEAVAGLVIAERTKLAEITATLTEALDVGQDKAATMDEVVGEAIARARHFAEDAAPQLVDALSRIRESAERAAAGAREVIAGVVPEAARSIETASADAVRRAFERALPQPLAELSEASHLAVDAATRASERLAGQLMTIAETTSAIEARIDAERNARETANTDNFSRRVSLLVEALNSASIDIAKTFSHEVSDSAWAAYLKGDRGVFTRRAVRLLDAHEAREISRMHDSDAVFRDHVNRYIHDFEAMLRQILALRDGSPLGVTLLSSDMGKLYVALAQAIERLRA